MKLDEIVPWGRSRDEYALMFDLSEADFQKRFLGCGDGPASFNAELTAAGGRVISVDPIYQFSGADIRRRFDETAPRIMDQVRNTPDKWVWKYHRGPDDLLQNRRLALERFLADYEVGRAAGRYRVASLPTLPFADDSFDVALCSHLLFLYSDLLSVEFHTRSILELCRVAQEVRIFPLLTLQQQTSPHLAVVCQTAAAHGYRAEIIPVPYELQRGGNQMLLIQGESSRRLDSH